jgi:urea transport system permease protein
MIRTTLAALAGILLGLIAAADARAQQADTDLQTILQDNAELVADASRRTVQEVLDILVDSQLPEVPEFLTTWQAREVYLRNATGFSSTLRTPTPTR